METQPENAECKEKDNEVLRTTEGGKNDKKMLKVNYNKFLYWKSIKILKKYHIITLIDKINYLLNCVDSIHTSVFRTIATT